MSIINLVGLEEILLKPIMISPISSILKSESSN